jgi:hypothetical protein
LVRALARSAHLLATSRGLIWNGMRAALLVAARLPRHIDVNAALAPLRERRVFRALCRSASPPFAHRCARHKHRTCAYIAEKRHLAEKQTTSCVTAYHQQRKIGGGEKRRQSGKSENVTKRRKPAIMALAKAAALAEKRKIVAEESIRREKAKYRIVWQRGSVAWRKSQRRGLKMAYRKKITNRKAAKIKINGVAAIGENNQYQCGLLKRDVRRRQRRRWKKINGGVSNVMARVSCVARRRCLARHSRTGDCAYGASARICLLPYRTRRSCCIAQLRSHCRSFAHGASTPTFCCLRVPRVFDTVLHMPRDAYRVCIACHHARATAASLLFACHLYWLCFGFASRCCLRRYSRHATLFVNTTSSTPRLPCLTRCISAPLYLLPYNALAALVTRRIAREHGRHRRLLAIVYPRPALRGAGAGHRAVGFALSGGGSCVRAAGAACR